LFVGCCGKLPLFGVNWPFFGLFLLYIVSPNCLSPPNVITCPIASHQGIWWITFGTGKAVKELEKENIRLKRLVADLSLDNAILKDTSLVLQRM